MYVDTNLRPACLTFFIQWTERKRRRLAVSQIYGIVSSVDEVGIGSSKRERCKSDLVYQAKTRVSLARFLFFVEKLNSQSKKPLKISNFEVFLGLFFD